jgi:hypothetical protein
MMVALIGASSTFASHLSGSAIFTAADLVFNFHQAEPPQQEPNGDKLVIGGSFVLEGGETLEGDLLVLDGTAKLLQDSFVEGDVTILGGTLTVDGTIEGDINSIGGLVALESSAHIAGDVNTLSANLDREPGAQVEGKVNTTPPGFYSVIVPGTLQFPRWEGLPSLTLPRNLNTPVVDVRLNPLWDGLWWLVRSFFWAAMAVLVALFAPQSIDRIAKAAVGGPIVSGGLGCLTMLIAPILLVLLAITICGLPISLIATIILLLGWGFGVIVLGAETGSRLEKFLKVDWTLPVAAGAGTFILTLAMNGIEWLVPCIGWLIPAAVGAIGLGAVLLTKFGTKTYPEDDRSPGSEPDLLPMSETTAMPAPETSSDPGSTVQDNLE